MTKAKRKHAARQKPEALQLKVTLVDSDPPIWRQLLVPASTQLSHFHRLLQSAMGWTNSHLHHFRWNQRTLGPDIGAFDVPGRQEHYTGLALADLGLRQGETLEYLYDFGDDWLHEILVERVLPIDAPLLLPVCLDGRRACPPEDCGGIGGYESLLDTLASPSDHGYAEALSWLDGPFDPEAFDLAMTNLALQRLFLAASKG